MCLAQGPQRSDAGEARTRGPLVSSQALYHWATALPKFNLEIISCDPSLYITDHPKINESNQKEESIKCIHVKTNRMPQKWRNYLSASVNQKQFWIEIRLDVSRKQFGSKSGPTHIAPNLDPNCLILKVFLIFFYFSEKGHFEENQKVMLLKSHTNTQL